MNTLPSLFKRVYEDGTLRTTGELTKGLEWWTSAGELREIIDGYDCAIINGRLHKQIKVDRVRTLPNEAIPRSDVPNIERNMMACWLPVRRSYTEDRRYIRALQNTFWVNSDGVYVLVGSRVKLNPYELDAVFLEKQYRIRIKDCERSFDGLREYFRTHPIYGIAVFDKRGIPVAQVKRTDFGFDWPPRKEDEDEG